MWTRAVNETDLCQRCLHAVNHGGKLILRLIEQLPEPLVLGQRFYLMTDVLVVSPEHCQNCRSKPPPPVADETALLSSPPPSCSAPQSDSQH